MFAPLPVQAGARASLSHRRLLAVVGDSDNIIPNPTDSESIRPYRQASRNFVEDMDVLALSGEGAPDARRQ
jgi:hypothetical protein